MITNEQFIANMCKSHTAIRKGINNSPSEEIKKSILTLKPLYDSLCKVFSREITITSGYRSEKLNKAIGGSSKSEHMEGFAMDLDMEDMNLELYNYIKNNCMYNQLIKEFGTDSCPSWVHVSLRPSNNRKENLRIYKKGNKTVRDIIN